jgi:ParB-like chromosome segregation protein Spo0J
MSCRGTTDPRNTTTSAEEYDALKGDIKRNGIQLPIILDEDEKILDGGR